VKFIEGLFDRPFTPPPSENLLRDEPSRGLALEAARESLVLLKNSAKGLPLDPMKIRRLLVCGPTAQSTETSFDRYGSSAGKAVSVLDGIRDHLARVSPATEVVQAQGCRITDTRWPESEIYPEPPTEAEAAQLAEAESLAAGADAVVVCVGDSNKTIGEALSRTSLELPGYQNDLVRRLVASGRPVLVVLMSGRPATINWIDRHAAAVLQAWFPGEAGGTAVAEALFGEYNPGGRLPVTFPRSVGQIPFNFPAKPGSQVAQGKKVDPNGFGSSMIEGPLYPFGHGLSYTTFSYEGLAVSPETIPGNASVTVSATLANTGTRAGDEVVQLYLRDDVSSVTTHDLALVGFERIHLEPGERRQVRLTIPPAALQLIDRAGNRVVEPGRFTVWLGGSSADLRLEGAFTVRAAE